MLELIAKRKTAIEAALAELKREIARIDSQAEALRQRRLQVLEAGIRLEGQIKALNDLVQEAAAEVVEANEEPTGLRVLPMAPSDAPDLEH